MQSAVERGARVIVLDIDDARIDFCQPHPGNEHAIDGAREDVLDESPAWNDPSAGVIKAMIEP